MRRAIFLLTLLVFLAASFPAPLLAEEKKNLHAAPKPSRGGPPEMVTPPPSPRPDRPHDYGRPPGFDGKKPPRPPFNDWPPKPGRPPGFKPPQWSIGLNIRPRPRPKPIRPWYATCPPYCVYDIYRDDDREEEAKSVEEETGYFEEPQAPEDTTYFQSGGTFERMEEEAAAPPRLQRDGYQADMDSYNLMMKAWQ